MIVVKGGLGHIPESQETLQSSHLQHGLNVFCLKRYLPSSYIITIIFILQSRDIGIYCQTSKKLAEP